MSETEPSIYKRQPREGGYTFVSCRDYPGFSFMLHPNQDDTEMNTVFVKFLAYNNEALAALDKRLELSRSASEAP